MRSRVIIVALSALLVSGSLSAAALATTGPTVTSVSAVAGPLVGGERVTLHGSGFSHVTEVLFGAAAAHGVRVVSSHALTVLVPRHTVATVNVRVVTPTGTSPSAKANRFSYEPLPVVTSVSVTSGATVGGGRVVLHGLHFLHVHSVLFGAVRGLAVRVASPTSLSVTAPSHVAGLADVRVVTAFGTSARRPADHFTFLAPTVTATVPPVAAPTPPPAQPIQVVPPAPVIGTLALPVAVQGIRYPGGTFTATSGTPPYTWSADGLPGGLTLSTTGVLSGLTRASSGIKQLRVTVTDSAGQRGTAAIPLTVHPFGGQLYAWGYNVWGMVGNGTMHDVDSPVKIKPLPSVVSVAGNQAVELAVESDGSVWGWGDDDGDTFEPSGKIDTTPVKLTGIPSATAVAVGLGQFYVLTATGTVWAWGQNGQGELGDGGTTNNNTPEQVPGLSDIVAIASTDSSAYAVRADGAVLAWGANTGFIGDGSTSDVLLPIVIPGLTDIVGVATTQNESDTWVLHGNGTVSGWGDETADALGDGQITGSQPTPVTIPGLHDIVQLVAGQGTAYALSADGTVLAWGLNGAGEVGNAALVPPAAPVQVIGLAGVQAVGTTSFAGFAILGDGTVAGWGANDQDDLGDGSSAVLRSTPVAVGGLKNTVGLTVSAGGRTGFAVEDQLASGVPIPPLH